MDGVYFMKKMLILLTFIILVFFNTILFAQADETMDVSGEYNAWPADGDNMVYGGEVSQGSNFPNYKIWKVTAQITDVNYDLFKFQNWSWGNQWLASSSGDGTADNVNLNSIITLYFDNSDPRDNMSIQGLTANWYYTFRFYDNGYSNSKGAVLATSANPISISSVQDYDKVSSGIAPHIKITLSGAKCAEENVLLVYTTDGWTSRRIVAAYLGENTTTYYAGIPAQTAGTTVTYFVLTSTKTAAQFGALTSDDERDLLTLSGNNNSSSNYSYIVGDFPIITEVMANPAPAGTGAASPEDEMEFVEIYNPTSSTIDLSNYDIYINGVKDDLTTWSAGKSASANLNDADPTINSMSLAAGQYAVILDSEYGITYNAYNFPSGCLVQILLLVLII